MGVIWREPAEIDVDAVDAATGRLGAHAVILSEGSPGERAGSGGHMTSALELTDRELTAWLAACDAVVEFAGPPTAAIPTAVVRALQLGVPLVVASTHPVPDGIDVPVHRADGRDADALTEAVERALADRSPGDQARRALERLAVEGPAAYRLAVDRTLALVTDPVEWTLARWADALLDSGVAGDAVGRGYGTVYTDALEELRPG